MWLVSLMLMLSVFLAACGGDKEKDSGADKDKEDDKDAATEPAGEDEQVLHLIETAEIPSVDSSVVEDAVGFNVLNNVMEGLYRLDEDSLAVPAMAEGDPEISEDGLTYTFKIRDAQWSNGTPVTAHDFVYAWQRAVDPDTGSPYGPYLMAGMIKNATEIGEGKAELSDLGIKAEDDNTLVVELEREVPYFLSLMSFGTFYPLNEEFVTEQGDDYASNSDTMIYNGPFVFTEWDGTGNSWKYLKNEDYWDADTVKLDEIVVDVVKEGSTGVQLYEKGQIDRVTLSAEYAMQYADDPDVINELETAVFYFKMNQERNGEATPLANTEIRKAIAKGFNKEELADAVLANGSIGANYLVPQAFTYDEDGKDFRDYSAEYSAYNVEEAQEHWKKGLEELGTEEVTIEILGGDTENAKKQQEWFKSELERNLEGLTIKLKEVPFNVRLELDETSDYDMQSAGWSPDFQDPISFIELFTEDSPQNKMAFVNKEYDELVEATKTTLADEPKERFEAFAKAEKILLEDEAAIIPQYQRGRMVLMDSKVKGLVTHPFGGDYSYKWTYIESDE